MDFKVKKTTHKTTRSMTDTHKDRYRNMYTDIGQTDEQTGKDRHSV